MAFDDPLLRRHACERVFSSFFDQVQLASEGFVIPFFIEVFHSGGGDCHFGGDDCLDAIGEGERCFAGGGAGCRPVRPENERELFRPLPLLVFKLLLQVFLYGFVDGLDLAVCLGVSGG